jgi:tetratricopeptide (TPR) repeat protein
MSEQKVEQAPPTQGAQAAAPEKGFFEYLSDNSLAAFRIFYDFMEDDIEKAIAKTDGPIREKIAAAVALGRATQALLILKRVLEIMEDNSALRYTLANAVLRLAQVYSALKTIDDPIRLSDITAKLDVLELDVYVALEKYLEALKQRIPQ